MKKTAAVPRSGVQHLLNGGDEPTRSSRPELAASWPRAARSAGQQDGDGSQKDIFASGGKAKGLGDITGPGRETRVELRAGSTGDGGIGAWWRTGGDGGKRRSGVGGFIGGKRG
ncbi:hypothetical protein TRIUR3_12581 [Triticum urartu]|uniref:Uncharacterized protein n=1 Tax=Triticum urartu TaxID=4572 RepID=M7ZGR7_TRIUA|nr:hypothetical protein TRIUR3_12581 [Triticum urartu]